MAEQPLGSISEHFSQLEDPRIERNKLHPLLNILVIAICGVISGAENWVDNRIIREPEEGMAEPVPGSDEWDSFP